MTNITQQEIIEDAKKSGFGIKDNAIYVETDYQPEWDITYELTEFAQLIEARLAARRDDRQSEPVATVYYNEQYGIKILPTTKAIQQLKPNDKLYLAAPQQAIPAVFVNVNHMKESNGNQWWSVTLNRSADDKAWDGHQVYTDKIEGRALYEAACLRHFFGQADKPNILDFDTGAPESAAPTAPIDNVREEKLQWALKQIADLNPKNGSIATAVFMAKEALIPSTQAPKPKD